MRSQKLNPDRAGKSLRLFSLGGDAMGLATPWPGSAATRRRGARYHCEDVTLKGAWSGPAAFQLFEHAQCGVARLPVHDVVLASIT